MLWVNEKECLAGNHTGIMCVGLLGPWAYDLINVPAEFTCNAPNVRLEGDYCGMPLSGILIFGGMIGGMVDASARLMEGGVTVIDWVSGALYSLFLLLIVLPLSAPCF
jgi:hypothetical protein